LWGLADNIPLPCIVNHDAKYVQDTIEALEKERGPRDEEYRELGRYYAPSSDVGHTQAATGAHGATPPKELNDELADSTGVQARRTLQMGLQAHLTPVDSQWCLLQSSDPTKATPAETAWLHYASQQLLRLLAPAVSNFYGSLSRSYLGDTAFGTSVLIPRLGKANNIVVDALPAGSYCLGEDGEGNPSTLGRRYTLTAAQCVQLWGPDTQADGDGLPPAILKDASKPETRTTTHQILHLIEPNPDADPYSSHRRHHPFRSLYVHSESTRLLDRQGYHEQPHAVGIWEEAAEGPYGIAPGLQCLTETRQTQHLEEQADIVAERAGNPPWWVPSALEGQFDPLPHGINRPKDGGTPSGDDMPREIPTTGRLDHLIERSTHKRQFIRDCFFYDLFRLLSDATRDQPEMTAYQVRELMGEKATLFHPFYARKTWQLSRFIRRVLALSLRAGLLLPPPPEMLIRNEQDGAFAMADPEVHFNSRLARALQINETNALLQTLDALLPLAGADGISSPVFDFIDTEKAGSAIARSFGIGAHLMATPDQIQQKQQARAQAAELERTLAAAQSAAGTARDLSQTL
jgi:hypothetical protein